MKKLIIGIIVLSGAALAQDDAAKPVAFGGFENSGSATFGYRFTDVKGYQPEFQEMFNLNSGPRLLDFNLFGKAQEGANTFADDYSLTASGMGGDPYTSAQFTIRKTRLYELRVNYRQSYYYWNQNDSGLFPNGTNGLGWNGLTSNHNWATVRKLGSINLLIHATNNLKFTFEYYRNSRDGVTDTTQTLDFFGSSGQWGSFARANPFYLIAPVSESANRVTGGIDYTKHDWTFHYRVGYQSFSDAINGNNATSPEQSININDPGTAKELATGVFWTDSRRFTTPVSEFSYTGKLLKNLEMRGGYIFYHYQGPASLDMSMDGSARTNSGGTTDATYAVALSTRANDTETNNVIDQGFTYHINDWWEALLDYRYSRFTINSQANFQSVCNSPSLLLCVSGSPTLASGTTLEQWRVGTSTLDFDMAFTPTSSLLIRAGVRLLKSDVEVIEDGLSDPARTKRIKSVWPTLSAHFQPSKKFTIRGDIEEINNGTSYTAVTPHTDIGGRIIARFRPIDKLYIENSTVVRNRTLLTTDYHSTVRGNSSTVNYDFSDKAAIFAGFSYDSNFVSDFVNFLRGTAPITNIALQDQTVDRVWTGGLRVQPLKRLGITFSGNFVRSTGLGQIAGELPLYGPMSFPYASGSLFYDFPRFGRLTAQLQRTYYEEQIIPINNFSANMLTLAWTRSF